MSNTTQILFNSPALHSLKRDQLVKLCKIHSIKASGKNVELIEKLKQHALNLQNADHQELEAAEDVEKIEISRSDSDQEGALPTSRQLPRPSEQWEVVMDSIDEVDEGPGSSQNTVSSKGTLRTLGSGNSTTMPGEFGTGSSKSSSVTSSIKALATSLGLNRVKASSSKSIANMSTCVSTEISFASVPTSLPSLPNTVKKRLDMDEELIVSSVPYSSIPESSDLPQTDHLTFLPPSRLPGAFGADTDDTVDDYTPLPGHPLRPGRPAPSAPDARLSLGLNTPARGAGPATTIRLVSGSMSNVASLFGDADKADQTRGSWNDTTWTGGDTPKLKPFATSFDLVLGSPGPIYPSLPLDDLIASKRAEPSTLGSSCLFSTASNTPSKASTSKATLSPPRPAPFVFGSPLPQHRLSNAQFQDAAKNVLEEMNKRLTEEGVQGVSTDVLKDLDPARRVDLSSAFKAASTNASPSKTQEAERAKVRQKFERAHGEAFGKMVGINEPIGVGKKRKSNVLMERSDRRASAGVRKRSSVGVGVRQGGIGVHRTSGVRVISGGRRKAAKMVPGGFGDDDESGSDENEDQGEVDGEDPERGGKRIKVADEEAAKKAKEEEEARLAREQENVRRKLERNKAARRSSIVAARQSMGRGRVSIGRNAALAQPKPSRFGFLSSAKSLVQGMWKGKSTKPPAPLPAKTGSIPVKSAPATNPTRSAPPPKITTSSFDSHKKAPSGSSSSRSSSTLLKPTGTDRSSTVRSNTSARSRSPIPSFSTGNTTSATSSSDTKGTGTRQSFVSTRTSAVGSTVNSVGTRGASNSRVSSMGIRGSRNSTMTDSAQADSRSIKSSLPRPSTSRLMAPTASSLAKIHARGSSAGLDTVKEKENGTRLPMSVATTTSPKPGIFSKHFSPSPSAIPTPIKASAFTSFGNAAATMAGPSKKEVAEIAPKPRSLNGRKPRISRSKVIAKLASQRAASGSSGKTSLRPSLDARHGAGKTRSSFGAKAHRESLGGGFKGGKGEAILMAKRKARASEYMRRKSMKDQTRMDVDS